MGRTSVAPQGYTTGRESAWSAEGQTVWQFTATAMAGTSAGTL